MVQENQSDPNVGRRFGAITLAIPDLPRGTEGTIPEMLDIPHLYPQKVLRRERGEAQ